MQTENIHATCVALPERTGDNGEEPYGILLLGPSGSGKSDFALRLITDHQYRLVSDDRTNLAIAGPRLLASPPDALRGKLEVRGVGIVKIPNIQSAQVILAIHLVGREGISRLPEPETRSWLGLDVKCANLYPFEPSAPAKIALIAKSALEPN